MLKINKRNFVFAALNVFGSVTLSSCVDKVSNTPLYGLIEGTYEYESQDGVLPAGWSFNADSKFEFVEIGPDKDYEKWPPLENGSWYMQKYTIDSNGTKQINQNCKIIWSNTPFDTLPYLKVAGTTTQKNNTAVLAMISPMSSPDRTWERQFCSILCFVTPLTKNDYSKRKISIRFIQNNENEDVFTVTFSM